jgi:DNA polymerase III epsilon subunit-like protein
MSNLKGKLLVVDIETTGFSHSKDGIVELGICELCLETGKTTKLFDRVFQSSKLTKKHNEAWIFTQGYMTVEEVRGQPDISFYAAEIQGIFDQYKGRVTAWNRVFDVGFLGSREFDLGKDISCPMKDSTNFFKIKGPKGFKWPKAQEAWDLLFPDTPRTELHRGYDDAQMEAMIIYELIKKGAYKPF